MTTVSARRATLAQDARVTLLLALPFIAAQLVSIVPSLVDVVMAGHRDAHTLAAVAVGANIWTLPLMTMIGVQMAIPPTVAQLDGAGHPGEVAPLLRQAIWLALGLGLILQQATFWGGPPLASLIGVDPALEADITRFVRAISWGLPGLGLFLACRGTTDGLARPRIGLAFGLAGLVVQVPLVWAFMYGRLGAPDLGAEGAGIATSVMFWLQALAYLAHLRRARRFRHLGWRRGSWAPDWRALASLLRLGGPIAVALVMETGMFAAAGLLIGRLGEIPVAAHQLAASVASTTFMVPLGIAMAVTVRVGQAVGRGDAGAVRRAGLAGLMLAAAAQALSCIAMLTVPHLILGLYTSDPRVIAMGVGLLALAAVFQFSDGIQVASAGALRGLKDTRMPMFITLFAYWCVGVPVGWYLTFPEAMGAPGMWVGLIAGLTTAAVLLSARFLMMSRQWGHAPARGRAAAQPG